ncbi:hypothetical protein M378DRAFT_169622 [Amanita muscaria Koide BX008]|uniref:Uncharacterized protein n=1 Tax=Amanita muscaria (strain Koide BX008) TaxID=946122 RepID=A0A0C2S8T7_AMAMK|nr:hypothetical protein M378DRAFT_169622 [Amanita muscaria Koide BX008]
MPRTSLRRSSVGFGSLRKDTFLTSTSFRIQLGLPCMMLLVTFIMVGIKESIFAMTCRVIVWVQRTSMHPHLHLSYDYSPDLSIQHR